MEMICHTLIIRYVAPVGMEITPYKQYGVSCRVTRLEVRHRSYDINILNKVLFVVFL